MQRCILVMVVCLFGFIAIEAYADTVKTTDGRTIIGLVVNRDKAGITIDTMVQGVREKITLAQSNLISVRRGSLPVGFFDELTPTTQPSSTTQATAAPTSWLNLKPTAATEPAVSTQIPAESTALDAQSKMLIDNLKNEIVTLRKDLIEYQKELRVTPQTTNWHSIKPGTTVGDLLTSGKQAPEPNSDYTELKSQIQKTNEKIASKEKEVSQLINNPAYRITALKAEKNADEERAKILAELQKRFADPTAVANQVVAVLNESKAIEEAAILIGTEEIHPRKALLYKSQILHLSWDWNMVAMAKPDMIFKAVDYKFKFITQAGLIRVNQGYVLLCKINGVWWPLQVNIDGGSAYWESYEHPLATPALWQHVAKAYNEQLQDGSHLNIVGLDSDVTVKLTQPDK